MQRRLSTGKAGLRSQGGFTLIELLVVIAIIGILAAIILASLATAKSKGSDASVEEELAQTRSQAELYSGATTAVTGGTCATGSANLFGTANSGLGSVLNGVGSSVGGFSSTNSYCVYAGTTLPNMGGVWAIAIKLPSGTGYWCVDYTGNSGSKNSAGTAYTTLTGGTAPAITSNACN